MPWGALGSPHRRTGGLTAQGSRQAPRLPARIPAAPPLDFCSTFSRQGERKAARGSATRRSPGLDRRIKKGQYLFNFEILALHFIGTRSEDRTRTAKGRGILSVLHTSN